MKKKISIIVAFVVAGLLLGFLALDSMGVTVFSGEGTCILDEGSIFANTPPGIYTEKSTGQVLTLVRGVSPGPAGVFSAGERKSTKIPVCKSKDPDLTNAYSLILVDKKGNELPLIVGVVMYTGGEQETPLP